MTVPRAPITTGITVTRLVPWFLIPYWGPSTYPFFSHSFNFSLCSAGTAKSVIVHILSLLIIVRFGWLAEIRWSVCMSKSQRSLWVSFSWTDSGWCIYHLFVCSNFSFLLNSQWITLPTQLCLLLYSFCANLSCISPHNLYLLFCCVLFISRFDIVCPCGVVLCCYQKRLSLSLKVSLSSPCPRFFHVKYRLLVIYNVYRVVFLPTFVFLLNPFCCSSCCQYCLCWLLSVFLRVFLCCLQVFVSMVQRRLQCWQVLFLPIFLTHIVCQRHLWDERPYAWSLVLLFSCPFVWVLLWSTSRIVPSILRGYTAQVFILLTMFLQ